MTSSMYLRPSPLLTDIAEISPICSAVIVTDYVRHNQPLAMEPPDLQHANATSAPVNFDNRIS